jgi:hypothetical protein
MRCGCSDVSSARGRNHGETFAPHRDQRCSRRFTSVLRHAHADQGGISFWLPGEFGSLAAVPAEPGWSFATIYYHDSLSAGGSKAFNLGGRIVAGVQGNADLGLFGPTYTFGGPVLGGQAAFSLLGAWGTSSASINATLTGPRGNSISGIRADSTTNFTDLFPQVSLKWNQGVHNFMAYATGDIPVGPYSLDSLSNTGLGHGAIDGGGGYTYFDQKNGHEFSAVAGLTYNFENPNTQYQNGVDFHFDWGASQFLNKNVHVGLVGYVFQQVTGDSGVGATLGSFESRVACVGPQIGFIVPLGSASAYINVKGYKEFAAENRP